MTRTTVCILLAATLATAACVSCRSRGTFDRVHFETLYYGQPDWDVQRTLGEPAQRLDECWIYVNDRPYYRAEIRFEDERVSEKTWSWTRPPRPVVAPQTP